ncbi:ergothioneine biosynthesis protein EgtC [Fodinicola feengrottensis]|uniref:Gamma-glutamyl-hercynylcysteine sulfoxide hydrolase n=1 Tax=Fodinicola feengrottensis TaxID=435914 RepID=A0ABN2HCK3_9ACTN|nr:ergothioneine biosynthesis protein EgtC [Fodinicola feengrottensis]
MCRHLAYLGPPVTLSSLLLEPTYGLHRQAWAPRRVLGTATVNVDGFGVGWYGPDGVGRYRRAVPMWTDTSFPSLASSLRSPAVLAAVRSASEGMPVSDGACAPFSSGQWLFSHNGIVHGWPESLEKLASTVRTADLMTLDAPTDAAVLWALVSQRLVSGDSLDFSLATVVNDVRATATGRLNLLLTDGERIAGTRCGESLYYLRGDDFVVVASEPYDDSPQWTEVPDATVVTATTDGVTLRSLDSYS